MRIFTLVVALFVGVLSTLGLVGCSTLGDNTKTTAITALKLRQGPTAPLDRPGLAVFQNEAFILRYAESNALTALSLRTGRQEIVNYDSPGLDIAAPNGLMTYVDNKRLYATWRPKMKAEVPNVGHPGEKFVYVAASDDGVHFVDTHRINNEGGAFPAVLTGNGLGDVYAVWQDERSGKNYDLYFNVSHDQGRTWKAEETRIDPGLADANFSAEPSMVAEGNSVWIVWSESGHEDGKLVRRLYVRKSDDRGETWRVPVVVAQPEQQAVLPQALRIGGRLHIYWTDEEGIKGATSLDNGQNWQTMKPLLTGLRLDAIQVSADQQGVVHMVAAAKTLADTSKLNLYYFRSADGVEFSAQYRLNEGAEYVSEAASGALAVDGAGNLLVTWMDKRYFRAIVYGRMSADSGLTWGKEMILGDGPDNGFSQLPAVVAKDKGFYLSYIHYANSVLDQGYAKVLAVDFDTKGNAPPKPADFAGLSARASEWWDSRLSADWGKSYDMMDPFMRARTKRDTYIAAQGLVKYSDYKIRNVEQIGDRRAKISMTFTSEVPKMEIYGRTIEVPKKEGEIVQEWIWIDGNWFFLFQDMYARNFMDY